MASLKNMLERHSNYEAGEPREEGQLPELYV